MAGIRGRVVVTACTGRVVVTACTGYLTSRMDGDGRSSAGRTKPPGTAVTAVPVDGIYAARAQLVATASRRALRGRMSVQFASM